MDKTLTVIMYKTVGGKRVCLEVSAEVKELLEQSDRQIQSQKRQDRRRRAEYSDGIADSVASLPYEDLGDLIVRQDRHKQLHDAIGNLSEVQRRRVILHYFGGLTHKQIAELDGVATMSVTDSIHQAKKKLKKLMKS